MSWTSLSTADGPHHCALLLDSRSGSAPEEAIPPRICCELEKLMSFTSIWYCVGGFGSADRLRFGFLRPAIQWKGLGPMKTNRFTGMAVKQG